MLMELVWEMLKRDLVRVLNNLKDVVFLNLYCEDFGKVLRDWDLWGLFFFIIFLVLMLLYLVLENKLKVFVVVFVILLVGVIVLMLNV